jgi:2-polyprenyl-6-methoxyphenol hydroxylase-like FAD-dependent oxidoreductase
MITITEQGTTQPMQPPARGSRLSHSDIQAFEHRGVKKVTRRARILRIADAPPSKTTRS